MKDGCSKDWSHEEVKKIVSRIQADDLDAFGELYEVYANRIFRRCSFMLKNQSLAEDAVHDVFLKMLVKIKDLKSEIAFEAWFNRLVYNHCIDLLRKHQKLKEKPFEDHDVNVQNRAMVVEQLEENRRLTDAMRFLLSQLDELDRTILAMYYWEGYTVVEISNSLEMGESAIKMRMKRTRDSIKEDLGVKNDFFPGAIIMLILGFL